MEDKKVHQGLYVSDRKIALRYGVTRGTIWRWVRQGNFPKPIRLSRGCVRWSISRIEDYEASLRT